MSVISMSATENPTNTNSAAAADAATIRRNQMLAIAMLVVCICLLFVFFPDSFRSSNLRYKFKETVPAPAAEEH